MFSAQLNVVAMVLVLMLLAGDWQCAYRWARFYLWLSFTQITESCIWEP